MDNLFYSPDTDIDDILRNKMSYEERLLRSSKLFFASQNLKAGMVYKVCMCVSLSWRVYN